jgi:hypothetical protein
MGDLSVVDVLLLEGIFVRELNMPIQILKAGSLAKADQLVENESIQYVVQLVDVLHHPCMHVWHEDKEVRSFLISQDKRECVVYWYSIQ